MQLRKKRGCVSDKNGPPYKVEEFESLRCPKQLLLKNPWIGTAWASEDLVTLESTNRVHDAISIVKAAESWRERKKMDDLEKKKRK